MSGTRTAAHPSQETIVVIDGQALDIRREELAQETVELLKRSKAERTWKAYSSDWKKFEAFCAEMGFQSMPASPSTVIMYITRLNKSQKTSTIQRNLSAISQAHQHAKQPNPRSSVEVKEAMKAVRRDPDPEKRRVRKAAALMPVRARNMLEILPNNLRGARDRAVLLLGLSSGLRRSEIARLNVQDVKFTREGMRVDLGITKTDQEGAAEPVPVLYGTRPEACPVRAMQDWIEKRGVSTGPLFIDVTLKGRAKQRRMSDRAVCRLLKRLGKAIGMSEGDIALLSGHSLRSGFITTARKLGRQIDEIKKVSRHKRTEILIGYIREADQWTDNPTRGITDADF